MKYNKANYKYREAIHTKELCLPMHRNVTH